MVRTLITTTLLLMITVPAAAQLGIYVEHVEYAAGEATLLILPDGTGPAFSCARGADGGIVDATVRIQLVMEDGRPLQWIPAEDVWLDFGGGSHLTDCGVHASVIRPDADSDADGWMTFSRPVAAGGWSAGPGRLYIMGYMATYRDWDPVGLIPLRVNSPDITGDLHVNLSDVASFAADYLGGGGFRSDFFPDGNLDLVDLSVFVRSLGSSCP